MLVLSLTMNMRIHDIQSLAADKSSVILRLQEGEELRLRHQL